MRKGAEWMKQHTSCPRGTRVDCTEPWRTWEWRKGGKHAVIEEKSKHKQSCDVIRLLLNQVSAAIVTVMIQVGVNDQQLRLQRCTTNAPVSRPLVYTSSQTWIVNDPSLLLSSNTERQLFSFNLKICGSFLCVLVCVVYSTGHTGAVVACGAPAPTARNEIRSAFTALTPASRRLTAFLQQEGLLRPRRWCNYISAQLPYLKEVKFEVIFK